MRARTRLRKKRRPLVTDSSGQAIAGRKQNQTPAGKRIERTLTALQSWVLAVMLSIVRHERRGSMPALTWKLHACHSVRKARWAFATNAPLG